MTLKPGTADTGIPAAAQGASEGHDILCLPEYAAVCTVSCQLVIEQHTDRTAAAVAAAAGAQAPKSETVVIPDQRMD